jgi:hypothetical protein
VAARLAALAAAPLVALALQAAPAGADDGPVIGFPPDDPCAPVSPLCDPLPTCPPIAPGPLALTVDLSFTPCDEPFAVDTAREGLPAPTADLG